MAARKLRSAVAVGAVSLALAATTFAASPAPAVGTCITKPDVVPIGDLTPGTMGTAYTVVHDRDIVTFDVEVLGVLPDGIAPGIDFILIKASGPVIDATGGIAAGMSGSPVLVGGKLAGSVSYGLWGDNSIGGLTPAEDIIKIMDYPPATAAPVTLTRQLRQAAADATSQTLASIPGSIEQIPVPVSVSGLDAKEIRLFQSRLDARGLPFTLFKGGSAPAPSAASAPALPATNLEPGSSFSALASYGDMTFGGVGTTTAVCGNLAMAWGHPMYWTGKSQLGMAAADIVTVVKDYSNAWGSYKVATIGETVGTVDQDRLTGLRGIYGQMPDLIPVTSSLQNTDLGTSRDGETDAAWKEVLPEIATFHTMSNMDVVLDMNGEGSASLSWKIDGTREDGSPFTFERSNMFYSPWSISEEAPWDLYSILDQIQNNDFEKVAITGVDIQGSLTADNLSSQLVDVQSSSPLMPDLRNRGTLKAKPGQKVTLRVTLDPAVGPNFTVDLVYKIPKWAHGTGPLQVSGGNYGGYGYYGYGYYYDGGSGDSRPESFDELLGNLSSSPRNNDIVVKLFPHRNDALDEKTYTQGKLVSGSEIIRLVLIG